MKLPNLKNLSKREKVVFLSGGFVVFLIAGYFFAVSPWFDYREKLKKQIRALEYEAQGMNSILSRAENIADERARVEKFIHIGVASEIELASFLKEIELFARQAQLSLQEIRPLKTISEEWFTEYGLEINFIAKLPEWIRFVHAVESSYSLLTIPKVRMEQESQNPKILKGLMQIKKTVVMTELQQYQEEA